MCIPGKIKPDRTRMPDGYYCRCRKTGRFVKPTKSAIWWAWGQVIQENQEARRRWRLHNT